ncbi:hypothetical protein NS44R_14605, partial [Mammaliicoccus sciuri]
MVALECVRILAPLVGAERAAGDLARHLVVAAGFPVALVPFPSLGRHGAVAVGGDLDDGVVGEPDPGKPAALVVEAFEKRQALALQAVDVIARIDGEMHLRALLVPGRMQEFRILLGLALHPVALIVDQRN